MNIFDCAIKMENEARVFYQKLAMNAAIPELKNLFNLLADSEQEHHDALVNIKEDIDSQKTQFRELEVMACIFKPLMEKKDLIAKLIDQPDAYSIIVKEEENGVRFYEELAEQTEDDKTRKVLLMIAKEERKHLSIVKNIYDFVESPKNYLMTAEFSGLKEY